MTPSALRDGLCEVTRKALEIDVRPFEGREGSDLDKELLPPVVAVVSEALDLLSLVLEHYEAVAPSEPPVETESTTQFYAGIDDLVASAPAAQRVADIAFMARWELQAKKQALQARGADPDGWSLLSTCGSARRRLIKSTVAVELALCQYESLDSLLENLHVTELRRSLETRRAYALFRKAVTKLGDSGDLRGRLRRGGTAIATLVGRDIYADLRTSDRKQLWTLQNEILSWLGGNDDFQHETGVRLCENLEVIANILLQVNHRAELQEHDRAVLAELYSILFSAGSPPETLPVALHQRLKPLLGRDPEIDRLIENPGARTVAEWQLPMRNVLRTLENRGDGHGADEFEEPGAHAPANASSA